MPFLQRGDDVKVERLTDCAGFLGAVQDGDRPHRLGDRVYKVFHRERAEQSHLDQADLFAVFSEVLNGFMGGVAAGPHHHDDAFGLGCPTYSNKAVRPAGA